jgi:O-antigen ligase/tetratricopeptide (TPR) repeat protein
MEAIVLGMVVLSPWAFGSVSASFLYFLYAALALLLLLWAARILVEREFTWKPCPLSLALAGLFVLGAIQLVPMPNFVLSWLSPGVRTRAAQLLPTKPEELPDGASRLDAGQAAGQTLSLYPGATRRELVKLLGVWLLFVVVRNNIAGPAEMARLSLAVLVNGSLLALFALVQFFSSPANVVYWHYPTLGQVFGPFVCRNHFPFYVNMAIGLGVGLLMGLPRLRRNRDQTDHEDAEPAGVLGTLFRPLHDPAVLWISVGLLLMIASVFVSLSRGGVLTLLVSAVVCLGINIARSRRLTPFEIGVCVLIAGMGLFCWFALEAVEQRLATIWSGNALSDSRARFWFQILPLALDFPLWGSGLGTFKYIEGVQRSLGENPLLVWEHAHNDYLEALIEGGLLRLALTLVIVAMVYRLGWRAMKRHRRRLGGPLALGAIFALTTVAIHSFVDFGLHIPAIMVLAVVIAAQLADLGKARRRRRRAKGTEAILGWTWLSQRRLLAGLSVLMLALFAVLLVGEGSRESRADTLVTAAERLGSSAEPLAVERQVEYLRAAVAATPENAALHFALAEALFDKYQKERAATEPGANQTGEAGELRQKYLVPALAHGLLARDLCPLLGTVQIWLADQRDRLARADPRAVYIARAKRLCPSHPTVWYIAGTQELAERRPEQAWFNWKQSLTASDQHLREILVKCSALLPAQEIVDQVLPDKPEILVMAANVLYPQPTQKALQRPFLEKALALTLRSARSPQAADYVLQARILRDLDRFGDAILAYQQALLLDPGQIAWRFQFAEFLYEQGRLGEAREQLGIILASQPAHAAALALIDAVERERPPR